MITYKDITYCVRQCSNMKCDRNIKHIKEFDVLQAFVSMASFDKCENWREEDEY